MIDFGTDQKGEVLDGLSVLLLHEGEDARSSQLPRRRPRVNQTAKTPRND